MYLAEILSYPAHSLTKSCWMLHNILAAYSASWTWWCKLMLCQNLHVPPPQPPAASHSRYWHCRLGHPIRQTSAIERLCRMTWRAIPARDGTKTCYPADALLFHCRATKTRSSALSIALRSLVCICWDTLVHMQLSCSIHLTGVRGFTVKRSLVWEPYWCKPLLSLQLCCATIDQK